jgi:hypothetical protein
VSLRSDRFKRFPVSTLKLAAALFTYVVGVCAYVTFVVISGQEINVFVVLIFMAFRHTQQLYSYVILLEFNVPGKRPPINRKVIKGTAYVIFYEIVERKG